MPTPFVSKLIALGLTTLMGGAGLFLDETDSSTPSPSAPEAVSVQPEPASALVNDGALAAILAGVRPAADSPPITSGPPVVEVEAPTGPEAAAAAHTRRDARQAIAEQLRASRRAILRDGRPRGSRGLTVGQRRELRALHTTARDLLRELVPPASDARPGRGSAHRSERGTARGNRGRSRR